MKNLQQHSCQNADGRCRKHVNRKSNQLICRVPRQCGDQQATFRPVQVKKVYDEETITILREISGDDFLTYDHLGQLQMTPQRAGESFLNIVKINRSYVYEYQ